MHVAVVGCGGSCGAFLIESVHMGESGASFDQVWALNYTTLYIAHDLGFVMDDIDACFATPAAQHIAARLCNSDTPFLVSREDERWPMGKEYPLDRVLSALGDDLLNNIGCYALGYGIAERVDMTLYGLDYYWDGHGTYEKGGQAVAYLIGLARGRGLKVNITAPSPMLDVNTVRVVNGKPRRRLYGYKDQPKIGHLPGTLGVEGAPL